ncbi:MAG: hypothetical protein DRO46_04840, partial [Candidatus Hecatellales archaeon]
MKVNHPYVASVKRVKTGYWLPGTDFTLQAVKALKGILQTGDVLAVSEKALAVASGLIFDESKVEPGFAARVLAGFWMRKVW